MHNVTSESLVIVAQCEAEDRTTLGGFFKENSHAIGRAERKEIIALLAREETYRSGGGAEAEWSIRLDLPTPAFKIAPPDMDDEEAIGFAAFWALTPLRELPTPDHARGWWYGHRRAYAMGSRAYAHNEEEEACGYDADAVNPFVSMTNAWEAWNDGYEESAALA